MTRHEKQEEEVASGAPVSKAADEDGEDEGAPLDLGIHEEAAGSVHSPKALEGAKRKLKWYVVHTYSGFEARAKKSLLEHVKREGLDEYFGEVLVPMERVEKIVQGVKRSTNQKFFPGYMLVQMELNDKTWHIVKSTPKITGFVGNARNPVPVRESDVLKLTQQIEGGTVAAKPRIEFEEGERVRVIDGPFSGFNGVVEEVKGEKQKVRVLVSIFGRATPVELDFMQVEKITG